MTGTAWLSSPFLGKTTLSALASGQVAWMVGSTLHQEAMLLPL